MLRRRIASGLAIFVLSQSAACASEDPPSGGNPATGGGSTTGGGETGGTGGAETGPTGGTGGAGGEGAGGAGGAPTGGSGGTGGTGGSGPNLCGNGVIDDGELCDGEEFGDKDCTTFGLSAGTLICNPFCGIVVSGCVPIETCGDGNDNDEDGLFDCEDVEDCGDILACTDPCGAAFISSIPIFDDGQLIGKPDLLAGSCAPPNATDTVIGVSSPIDTDILVSAFSGGDVAISIRTVCDDASTEIACKNDANSQESEQLVFSAQAGVAYYVVLEGTTDTFDTFYNVSIQEQEPESFCDDFFDDDFDGYLDCDDPDCLGDFLCDPGPGENGEGCFSNTECAAQNGDPICLGFQLGFDGGYCSEFCAGPGDCPNGGVCKDVNISVHGACYRACVTTDDCPPGTECADDGTGQLSCDLAPELNCQDYADNDFDSRVDCEDPACATSPSCAPGALAPGLPCQLHSQCAVSAGTDPVCIDQFHNGWPGGYCSEYCDIAVNDCPTGTSCVDVLSTASGSGTCMKDCVDDVDCRSGYFCNFDNVCVP